MFQHYVKEYDTLQLIVGFIQTKPTTPMTNFIYDTISSVSTTHIGIQYLLFFFAKMLRNLDHKHTVGKIQFPSF